MKLTTYVAAKHAAVTGTAAICAGALLVACSGQSPASGAGGIAGQTPICYGPGPNDNLKPIINIRATRSDGLVRKVEVHTSNGHSTYRMNLPSGRYTVSTYSGHVTARVQPGRTTTNVDLPQPGCL